MDNSNISPLTLDLQLLAEGGAGAGDGGTGAEGATGVNATAAVSPKKGVKADPYANVVFGTQKSESDGISAAEKSEDKNAKSDNSDRKSAYNEFIKANKDLDDARVQDIVQKRVRENKEQQALAEKYTSLKPMFEMLGKKYGVDASDPDAIVKAIEDDDAYYEQEALEKGMEVSELKAFKKIQRENETYRQREAERERKEAAQKQVSVWQAQEAEAKSKYPSLSLESELSSPTTGEQFARLLRSGIDVGTAYSVIHMDEIVPVMMQHAEQSAKEKMANKIASNASRPNENGMASQAAMQTKSDVSQLTKNDRAEILRRVARGERISFTK